MVSNQDHLADTFAKPARWEGRSAFPRWTSSASCFLIPLQVAPSNPTSLALSFLLCASALQAGEVFWTDRGANQLKRMNFDGSDIVTITLSGEVTSSGTNTRGLTLDLAESHIYWADNGADRILRADLDGSNSTILTTITGSSFPADVHLDASARTLYWCDRNRGQIEKTNLPGGTISIAIDNAAPSGPYFMDFEQNTNKIYWGDFSGGAIYRADPDGSNRETLLTGNNNTRGIRVDPLDQMLYWVNRDDKQIHRAPLSAFDAGTIPLTHPSVETLYEGLDTPHGLTIDIPARKLYWADTGSNLGLGLGGNAVSRGDLDGSTPVEVIAAGDQPWDVELDRRCRNYDEWRMRCFRRDTPSPDAQPEANPDHDLYSNLLEYLFDLAPNFQDPTALPETLLVAGPLPGASYAALCYRRRQGTSDLTSYLQISANLSTWSGSPASPVTEEVSVRSLGNGMEEVLARLLDPVSTSPAKFLRVAVEFTP